MTIRTGKGGRYRYYACSTKARQGPTGCEGMAVPMEKLDDPALKDRVDGLKAIRDQAKADAERARAILQNSESQAVTPQMVAKFARAARQRIRLSAPAA